MEQHYYNARTRAPRTRAPASAAERGTDRHDACADQGPRGPDRSRDAGPERPLGAPDARTDTRLTRPTGRSGVTRTVLITGGAGFIGSNLTRRLVGNGDEVRILDDLSIGQAAYLEGRPARVAARFAGRSGNRSVGRGRGRCRRPPGGAAGIDDSVRDPLGTFEANVAWSVSLLEAARLAASGGSSSPRRMPPPATTHPERRDRPPLPDLALRRLEAGDRGLLPGVRRDLRPRRMLPAVLECLRAIFAHKRSVVAAWLRSAHDADARSRSTATAGRPATSSTPTTWPRRSRRRSTRRRTTSAGELFQAGTGVETTVAELAEAIGRRRRPVEVRHAPARPGDIGRNVARVDKAVTVLGYRARVPLREGLAETAAWFAAALEDPALAAVEAHAASGSE